jgi:hypothetical protein
LRWIRAAVFCASAASATAKVAKTMIGSNGSRRSFSR